MKLFTKKVIMIFIIIFVSTTIVFSNQLVLKKKPLVIKFLIKVGLTPMTKYYISVCPVKVKMTGTIKVPKAMSLQYNFTRSDGAKSRLTTLIFRRAGIKNVSFAWTIGRDYKGWVQLVVKNKGSLIRSNKVEFQVKCKKKPVLTPAIKKPVATKINATTPQLIFIQKNTNMIIHKLTKHLPATLNSCTLAKWTMKAPKPSEDPKNNVVSSIWETTFDGMDVRITSVVVADEFGEGSGSVSPGYQEMIISGIKLTINATRGYNRDSISAWILKKYGSNTRVGSTKYSIEYMTNCWFFFKMYHKKVIVELKWNG